MGEGGCVKTPFLQLLGLVACSLFLATAGPLRAGETLRLASYNVRNYLSMDRQIEGRFRLDYPKREQEKAVVRESIRRVSPDVLAVQEVGSLAYLEELRKDLEREGEVYEGIAVLEANDPTRKVGALWRGGLEITVVEHRDLEFSLFEEDYDVKRGMLELEIRSGEADAFSVFVLHLKSKYTDDARDFQSVERRTREAQAARDRILERYPDPAVGRFAVVGDLNDGPDSSAVRRFFEKGEMKLTEAVDCWDDNGEEWTHYFRKGAEYARIDYILLSPGLSRGKQYRGSILTDREFYKGSDHRLIWVDLSL